MHIYLSDGKYQSRILSKGFHIEKVNRVNNIKINICLKCKKNNTQIGYIIFKDITYIMFKIKKRFDELSRKGMIQLRKKQARKK